MNLEICKRCILKKYTYIVDGKLYQPECFFVLRVYKKRFFVEFAMEFQENTNLYFPLSCGFIVDKKIGDYFKKYVYERNILKNRKDEYCCCVKIQEIDKIILDNIKCSNECKFYVQQTCFEK